MPPRLPTRVLVPLLAVLALVVGACTDPGELGSPGPGGAPAARIGEMTVSNADLEDEVERWATSPSFLASIDPEALSDIGEPGRRSAALVAFVLSHRVISEQARTIGEITGYQPAPQELDQLRANIEGSFGSLFLALPEDFRSVLIEDLAYQTNLQNLGPDLPVVPVEVNPRYGSAVDVGGGLVQVEPPTGPVPLAPEPGTFAG